MAFGNSSKASGDHSIAFGHSTKAEQENAVAIGTDASASASGAVALGQDSKALGNTSVALGKGSTATGGDSAAIGWRSNARKNNDIAFGNDAQTRDQGAGHSVAIGAGASAASNAAGTEPDRTSSTGKLNSAGGVAIGTDAYTGINKNGTAINSSVAVGAGAGAGAGYRGLGDDGLPTGNGTDPDDNATVLAIISKIQERPMRKDFFHFKM